MSNKKIGNRINRNASNQSLIAGLTKHATTLPTLMVGGTSVAIADVIASLQADIAATAAVGPAENAWRQAVAAARAQTAKTQALASGVKQTLKAMFAGQPTLLGDFGLTPRKVRTPLTADQKAAAVAKAKATRVARGTRGSVQKAAVTGNVVGVTVTPVTAAPVTTGGSPPTAASPSGAASPTGVTSPPAPATQASTPAVVASGAVTPRAS